MIPRTLPLALLLSATAFHAADPPAGTQPVVPKDQVSEEKDGVITIEAEHFHKQALADKRVWYITSAMFTPKVEPDGDPPHLDGASGGAYIELLPDTRRSHNDKLVKGENFINEGGKMAVLSYKVRVKTPGRYYVWARVYSTTPEDNGLHFGLDGKWPESGARWQTTKKNGWHWDCRQRTVDVHVGVLMQLWLDVEKAGEHELLMSMREDGIEVDQIALARDIKWRPEGFKEPAPPQPVPEASVENGVLSLDATAFTGKASGYYLDQGKWLAINPGKNKEASASAEFPFPSGTYDVTLKTVGESDGESTYQVAVGGAKVGEFKCPLGVGTYDIGPKFNTTFKGVAIKKGDPIDVSSKIATLDGKEYSRARVAGMSFTPADGATKAAVARYIASRKEPPPPKPVTPSKPQPRGKDGDGSVAASGELKQWHKVTLTLDGPFANERDDDPNPFTDYRMTTTYRHESGSPVYRVPGYFAADGDAANTSATRGNKWRAYLSPDKPGKWTYAVSFVKGKNVALNPKGGEPVAKYDGRSGAFEVAKTDKTGRDLRAKGRLEYVGGHYLRFAGNGEYFLKAGPDAPETLLAYADFDGTEARKKNVPLKTWQPHAKDWNPGDPTWKGDKGKGLVGALNYLSEKGCTAFSFLTYNAGGDGDNVWPFVAADDKLHYDCSKLDQWGIVFDHAQAKGLYLHFKMQEQENDDDRVADKSEAKPDAPKDRKRGVAVSLDGGDLGPERMLYCRELIARYGHCLALNWNLGEENTQSAAQQKAMAVYIRDTDPYRHNIVVHTFPGRQDAIYTPLLGNDSPFTGASLQNGWNVAHQRTLKWVAESARAGKPWVVANDEQGPASLGVPPDKGYMGHDGVAIDKKGKGMGYTADNVRKLTLWGTLTAGGAGVEYYFGYQLPQNDLLCEDFRSRDRSWDYCRFALDLFRGQKLPFWEMANADALVGNPSNDNSRYCLAKPGEVYLVYLPAGGTCELDLGTESATYRVDWFNPRAGGDLITGSVRALDGPGKRSLGDPPSDPTADWAVLVCKTR